MVYPAFHDGNIAGLIQARTLGTDRDFNGVIQTHSSLLRRLHRERELEGDGGAVSAISWSPNGLVLISAHQDRKVHIWSFPSKKAIQSIETGHSDMVSCTKFVSNELLISGGRDAKVHLYDISCSRPTKIFQCHTEIVKQLAVEVGNPNLVWSASSDGTLRQFDFRDSATCTPAGSSHHECCNILLDLRSGAKQELMDVPYGLLALTSCDINTTRPHLLLVGGSDKLARLYDRRKLPTLSSSREKSSAPPCVEYFCPMHFCNFGPSSLHLTCVTFSPSGEELLLSYCGEHAYLMDVNVASTSTMRYTKEDFLNLASTELKSNNKGAKFKELGDDECIKLVKLAEEELSQRNYCRGIELCNEVLDGHGHLIRRDLLHYCLCLRACFLLKRMWRNDTHMAIRDCNRARKIDPDSYTPLCHLTKALFLLGNYDEARELIQRLEEVCPPESDPVLEDASSFEIRIENVLLKRKHDQRRASAYESGYFFGSSDNDEEWEQDFQTSGTIEQGDVDLCQPCDTLLITERGVDRQYTEESEKDRTAIDMKQRYAGHCNELTDTIQASFIGQRGEYVASGSRRGKWFIWEKKTGRLLKMLKGDEHAVNCVQCHPYDCFIATSGLDSTVKIWTPAYSSDYEVKEIDNYFTLRELEAIQETLCSARPAADLRMEFRDRKDYA